MEIKCSILCFSVGRVRNGPPPGAAFGEVIYVLHAADVLACAGFACRSNTAALRPESTSFCFLACPQLHTTPSITKHTCYTQQEKQGMSRLEQAMNSAQGVPCSHFNPNIAITTLVSTPETEHSLSLFECDHQNQSSIHQAFGSSYCSLTVGDLV